MLAISDEEKAAWLSPSRQLAIRVSMLDAVYDNDSISSMSFDSGSISGETYQIGSTYMNTIKLVFPTIIESVKEDVELSVSLGVLTGTKYSYVKLGIFYITEFDRDRNSNQTTVTASDKMIYMEGSYNSKLKYPAQYRDVALEIANLAGVEVDEASFQSLGVGTIAKPEGYTYRQAIGLIAQFEGGFASFNREGKLEIRRLRPTDFTVSPENYLLKGFKKNENSYRIGGITAKIGNDEEDTLHVGSLNGSQVELENKVMTQILLNKTWDLVKSLNYFPFELKWQGCPALEAGDWFYVKDKNGTRYSVPNLSYSFNFAGGLVAESKAITNSASQATYRYKGPLHQKIDNIDSLLSANNWNSNYYDQTEPTNPKEGDIWFKPNGQDTELWVYKNVDGKLQWVLEVSTAPNEELQEQIDNIQKDVDDAKEEAEQATDSANKAVSDATHAVSVADQSKAAADEAKADAATAIENAQSILNDLQNLDTVNLLKNSTWNLGKGDWTGGRTYFEVLDPEQDKPSNFILHGLPLPVSTQQWTQIPHHIWCEKGQQFCVTFDYREINYTNNSILAYLRVFPEQNSVNTNSNALWHDSILHSEVGIESNSTEWKKVSYTFTVGASGWLNFIVYDGDASGNHESWYREIMVVRSSTVPKTWSPYPGDAQSQINLLNGQIVLKANQADVDVLNGTITNIESSLTTQAGQITFLNSLTDGHTTQLGSLQSSYEGLSSTIAIVQNDLDGKATIEQFSNLSQTVDTIQGTVANKAEQSQVTQLADQITSVVGLVESEGTNLILNGSFADASNWMIPTTTTTGFYSSAGCPIDAGTYIRVSSTSASHSIVQRPNASMLTRLAGKTVNLSTYARALGTADNFRIYVRVTDSAGVNTYLNINTLYSIDTAWKRYSAVVTFPTDVVAVNITINFQNLSGIKCYCTGAQLTLGENLYPYTESTLNFATQSQITQLSDLINLRVVKGDVINQINISPESILIAGNKIQITGQTYIENSVIGTAQIKDAAITDAKIGNLSANKITTGSLNAANVNIINMNASNIVTGELTGITLRSSASGSSFYVRGNELFMQKANGDHLTMDTSGIYWYNSKGDILFQSSKKLTTSDIFGTAKYNAYLAAFNETRSVTYASALSGSGGVSDYSYVPHRTGGIYSNWLEVNTFGTAENLYIRPKTAESEVRITVSGGTDSYARLRARWIFADRIINNSFTNANHLYLHTNDEVRVRTMNLNTKTGGYRAIRASAFNTSSLAEYKTNIETFEKSALDIIGQSTIYSYNLKTDIETAEIGLVIGEGYSIAQEVVNGDGVSQYRMNSLSWKAIQELHEKIKDLENELAALKSA